MLFLFLNGIRKKGINRSREIHFPLKHINRSREIHFPLKHVTAKICEKGLSRNADKPFFELFMWQMNLPTTFILHAIVVQF